MTQQGDSAAGVADIREAMDRRRKMGMGAVWPWYLALYAERCGALGQIDEGLQALDEAAEWVQRNDERLYAAEVYRFAASYFCVLRTRMWRRRNAFREGVDGGA